MLATATPQFYSIRRGEYQFGLRPIDIPVSFTEINNVRSTNLLYIYPLYVFNVTAD